MNRHYPDFLVLIILSAIYFSCGQNHEEYYDNINLQSEGKFRVKYKADSSDHFIMIYDYDTEAVKLHYRPVKMKNLTANYLNDVIQAFLSHNHFLEPTDAIQLDKVEKKEDLTIIYFSGLEDTGAQKDKADFFKKALELTIKRNFHNEEFQIVLNEEFP